MIIITIIIIIIVIIIIIIIIIIITIMCSYKRCYSSLLVLFWHKKGVFIPL